MKTSMKTSIQKGHYMSKNENQQDFFTEVFDVNDHRIKEPRIIGGRITKEQAQSLGIEPKQEQK